MIGDTFLKNTQIGFFNPGRLTDAEIERAFIARMKSFEYLLEKILSETPGSIPQHHLIIAQRGMGKSTLLYRVAAELRKLPHAVTFIPLSFPEEQYNVDRLSKFWLNCMDALADALEKEGKDAHLDALDAEIASFSKQAKALAASDVLAAFLEWTDKIGRRAVLLVDNLNLIFDRLNLAEQHELRANMMEKNAPILVGASASTVIDTVDYGAPFYDAFQMHYLKKLTFEESMEVLENLARITGNTKALNSFFAHKGRLRTLYQLTGGTPRTLVMLYPLIQDGFSDTVQTDLEGLMDLVTPLYKARFEELPPQMQIVLDAVALHWDPVTLDALRQATFLENSQLAPQIKRLTDTGWLHRMDAYQTKGSAYEINERFFNIWYLMRRSSRRQKKELLCLTKFLAALYGEDLPKMGKYALAHIEKNVGEPKYLNKCLSVLSHKNIGQAEIALKAALMATNGKISNATQDDWWRFAAITHKLGYIQEVLSVFEKTGYDKILQPYYIALKAMIAKDSTGFLNSIAAEVREPAAFILEKLLDRAFQSTAIGFCGQ